MATQTDDRRLALSNLELAVRHRLHEGPDDQTEQALRQLIHEPGVLGPGAQATVWRHLSHCAVCRATYARLGRQAVEERRPGVRIAA